MPTQYFFNNKEILIPGAYGQIKSGVSNPALSLAFGNLLVIDTGSGAGYGGGSGVAGTLETGADSLYTFTNIRDFRSFVGGGLWWLLARPLFIPANGVNGINSITYIRAAATTPATMSYTWTGGGSAGGSITFQAKDEGRVGNGFESDETRSSDVITISDAGDDTDAITITVGGVTVATYTNDGGESIAQMVAGLAASVTALAPFTGYELSTSDATTLTILAPRGLGVSGDSLTSVVTGDNDAAGSSGGWSGGANGTNHVGGYNTRMVAGTIDTSKYVIEFYKGNFKGYDTPVATGALAGESYDNVPLATSGNTLLVKSAEFDDVQELLDWTIENPVFNRHFNVSASTVTGTGVVDATDLTNSAGNNLALGGAETYSTTHLNSAIDAVADGIYDFILADKWGAEASATENITILSFISTEAKIKPDFYVGGGLNENAFTQAGGSVPVAQSYNNQYTTVVHGGVGLSVPRGNGFKDYQSIYHAAAALGREAGLPPQVPLTFKQISIGRNLHKLKENEVVTALKAGVLVNKLDNSSFEYVKGVNSLQTNTFLVNDDGSTHSKQLRRIARQINKELTVNIKANLLKQVAGPNRNTVSTEDVSQYVKTYLKSKEATDTADNLILEFKSVTVTVEGDAYFVEYEFVPNFEVSFVFSTGFIVDPTN